MARLTVLVLLQAEGVCTDLEASTSLKRPVDRSIEGPVVNKRVTALLRISVVQGHFDRLI